MIQLAVVRASSVGGEGVAMTLYHDSVGWGKGSGNGCEGVATTLYHDSVGCGKGF